MGEIQFNIHRKVSIKIMSKFNLQNFSQLKTITLYQKGILLSLVLYFDIKGCFHSHKPVIPKKIMEYNLCQAI